MAGYKVKVVIPYDFLLVRLNVIGQADIDQYEECLAFALADRWDIEDITFEINKEVDGHSYESTPDSGGDRAPSREGFSLALEEAINRYAYLKTGIPTAEVNRSFYDGYTFSNPRHMFTPTMTNKLEESESEDSENN